MNDSPEIAYGGCGRLVVILLLLLWLASAPTGAMLLTDLTLDRVLGPQATSAAAITIAGLALLPPFALAALLTRRRAGWAPVAATAAALTTLAGHVVLDAAMRAAAPPNASLATALRLATLTAYTGLAAWLAPRLAGVDRRSLWAWLGLHRCHGPTFLLALALAALLTLPWPVVGALGDRFASLEIALQALAETLPSILLLWGVAFALLTSTFPRTELAALTTVLLHGAVVAGGVLPAAEWDALARAPLILPLALLLTELRAREGGIYTLLPPALLYLLMPRLFTDPREELPPLLHAAAHTATWALLALVGPALFILRRLGPALRGQVRVPTPVWWASAGLAAALLWATWGGLFAYAGNPRFYDDGFLIILEEQADLSAAEEIPDRHARIDYVYATLVETAERTQAPIRVELERMGLPYRPYYIINMIRVDGHRNRMAHFESWPGVAQVLLNPNRREYPHSLPYSLYGEDSWDRPAVQRNLTTVRANAAWELGVTGEGIVVAGQDTGYDWAHPALQPHYRGWDGRQASHDTNWHDAWDDTAVPFDDDAHGTHTMGTVLGDDGAGNRTGVAPGAQWIGCRNMRSGLGNPGSYAECFEFFLAPYPHGGDPFRDGDAAQAPHLVTNSWGCPPEEGCLADTLQPAVDALWAAGIMVVVGAGNDGPGCGSASTPPANYDSVFTVGATYKDGDVVGNTAYGADDIVYFSSRGPVDGQAKPDIAAPGYEVRSSVPGGGYGYASGTSMATPHVAGLVALLWSANPDLIGDIVTTEQLICATAQPVPVYEACAIDGSGPQVCACGGVVGAPNNVYGCGVIDAEAAVRAALAQALQ